MIWSSRSTADRRKFLARRGPGGCISDRRWVWIVVVMTAAKLVVAASFEGTVEVRQMRSQAVAFLAGRDVLDPASTGRNPSFFPIGHYGLVASCWLLAQATGLSFAFVVKVPAILADVLVAVLLAHLARGGPVTAALYVLSPVTVLLSAYHAQPHSVAVALAVLSFWAVEQSRPGLSALALALAASIRQHFLILGVPLALAMNRGRARFAASLVAIASVLVLPSLAAARPGRLLAPAWPYGSWGYTIVLHQGPRLLALRGVEAGRSLLETVNRAAQALGPWLYWVWMAAFVGWVLKRASENRLDPWRAALLFLLGFYSISPGFGVQWLVWAVPFWLVIDRRGAIRYNALAGVFLAASYWQWTLNVRYHVASVTANLNRLNRGDLIALVCVGALALATWAYSARSAWRLWRA